MFALNEIIHIYSLVIKDFILLIKASEIICNSPKMNEIVYIGINTIHHVFVVSLMNVDIQQCYVLSKKAACYYLEYIEQINHSAMNHTLNTTDAVVFIYNKILDIKMDGLTKWAECDGATYKVVDILPRFLGVANALFMWETDLTIDVRIAKCDELGGLLHKIEF